MDEPSKQNPQTKQCPYCAETILAAAVACRFCGRDLTSTGARAGSTQAPETKKSIALTLTLVAVAVLVMGAIYAAYVWSNLGNSGSGSGGGSSPNTYSVKYQVTGNPARASLTYENDSGNTEQKDVTLPWTETFIAVPGQFLYVSAQLDGDGSITCEIYLDGVVWQEATSDGNFVIASCSGSP